MNPEAPQSSARPAAPKSSRGPVVATGIFCVLSLAAAATGGGLLWQNLKDLDANLQSEAQDFDRHVAKQTAFNKDLNTGVGDLRSSVAASHEANRQVAQSVGDLSGQIAELTVSFDKNFTELASQQETFDAALGVVENKTAAQDRTLATLNGQLAENLSQLEALEQDALKRIAALDGMSVDHASAIDGLREADQRNLASVAATRDVVARLESRYSNFETALADVRQRFDDQAAQIAEIADLAAANAANAPSQEPLAGLSLNPWSFSNGLILGGAVSEHHDEAEIE